MTFTPVALSTFLFHGTDLSSVPKSQKFDYALRLLKRPTALSSLSSLLIPKRILRCNKKVQFFQFITCLGDDEREEGDVL